MTTRIAPSPPSPSPENRTPNEECGSGQRVPAELTNCDRCAMDRQQHDGTRGCASHHPGRFKWAPANCLPGGDPKPGATNCPGFAPVGGAS